MIIRRNADGVRGQRKVGNPCLRLIRHQSPACQFALISSDV